MAQSHDDAGTGKRLDISVVTPQGSVLARQADELIAPGLLGELGILPGHLPLLSALKPGVLVWRAGEQRGIYAVSAGYVQVGAQDRVQVLVSRAVAGTEVDVEEAQAELDAASGELKGANSLEEGFADKRARWEWARARLDAAHRAAPEAH